MGGTVIPTPFTIGVRPWAPGAIDAHGNPADEWGPPVTVAVHAVAPRVSDEAAEPRRHQVVEGLTVYAPAGTRIGEHDRVVYPWVVDDTGAVLLAGDEYDVDGPPADWTKGPWQHPTAGVVAQLKRTEG